MAKVYISQFARQGRDDRGPHMVGEFPELGTIILDTDVSGGITADTLNKATRRISVYADATVMLRVDKDPKQPTLKEPAVVVQAATATSFSIDLDLAAVGVKAAAQTLAGLAAGVMPTVTITAAQSRSEGDEGVTVFPFIVDRSDGVGTVDVPWTFDKGDTLPNDYAGNAYPAGGIVRFAVGETRKTIPIAVAADKVFEGDEQFGVAIAVPAGYAAGLSTSALAIIRNDDSEQPATPPPPPPPPPPPDQIVVTPAPAAYSDSFVGDGPLHTRLNWTIPAGEQDLWGTASGQLLYKKDYGPFVRAVFGDTIGDQEVTIEYDTTTKSGQEAWTKDNTFFDLFYRDENNFLRVRFPKGATFVQIQAVINGTEGRPATFNRPTPASDKGNITINISDDTIRVAWDGNWTYSSNGRGPGANGSQDYNYPFDRFKLSDFGASVVTSGKLAVEARTWAHQRADSISVTASQITIRTDDEFVGPDSPTATGGTWAGTGVYVGTPVKWAARVLDFITGSVVTDWDAPKSVEASGGTFTIGVFIPFGGPNVVEIAWIGADGLARITRSRPVLSGYHVVYYGQSNSLGRSAIFEDAERGYRWASFVEKAAAEDNNFPGGHFASLLTGFRPVAATGTAKTAAQSLNIPVAVTVCGSNASGIYTLSPGGTGWETFVAKVAPLKGIISAVIWDQGEADADGAQATPDYVDKFRDLLLPALRQVARNPAMPVLIARVGNYPDATPPNGLTQTRFNAQREAIRQAHQTLVDTVPGVSFASFKLGANHGNDAYHYGPATFHGTLGIRDGLSVAKVLGAATYDGRGPQVTGATRNGATITLAIGLNGAASIAGPVAYSTYDGQRATPPANSFKGYEVSADNFATLLPISDIAVSGGNLVITLASAPSGAVKVRSMAGGDYDDTSLFVGQYTGGLTIPVAPIIKYLSA